MNCPGCNQSSWEYVDEAVARCKYCGYLLDPYPFDMKGSPSSGNFGRSETSKRLAIIALLTSFFLYLVSLWYPEWQGLWVIGVAARIFLFIDHLLYL